MRFGALVGAMAVLGLASVSVAQPAPADLSGEWDGALTLGGNSVRIVLHFADRLTWDSPDQGSFGLPATWTRNNGVLSVTTGVGSVTMTGPISSDGKTFEADFSQGVLKAHIPFLHRAAGAPAPGPIGPPLGPGERSVTVDGGRAPLYGTLLGGNGGKPGPAVLLLAGSGPTDRDGNSAIPGHKAATLKLIAQDLARRGYTSLRADKRGVGQSRLAFVNEESLRFQDFVEDAARWAQFLKVQPGVTCVVLLGHSEGALIASLTAQKVPVCGLIEVSGNGGTLGALLRVQNRANGMTGAELIRHDDWITRLEHDEIVPEVPATDPTLRPSVQPFTISEINIDPAAELKKVKAPVLIIHGDSDLLVPPQNARVLAAARPDAKLVMIPNASHPLKEVGRDLTAQRVAEANPDAPLAPGVSEAIADFLGHVKP